MARTKNMKRAPAGLPRPHDISAEHGVPFPVFNMKEVNLYKSLVGRKITRTRFILAKKWEEKARKGNEMAAKFLEYIGSAECYQFAEVSLTGYVNLTLEFLTTFKKGNNKIIYRLKGKEYELKAEDVTNIFGIDGNTKLDATDEDFRLTEFWDDLTRGRPGNYEVLNATQIEDDVVYMVYKFITLVILNKEESSKLTIPELQLLWCIEKGHKVQFYPSIINNLKNIAKEGSDRRITYGGFVTAIAHYHGLQQADDDKEIESEFADISLRRKDNKRRHVVDFSGSDDEMDIDGTNLGDDDEFEDEDYEYETDEERDLAFRIDELGDEMRTEMTTHEERILKEMGDSELRIRQEMDDAEGRAILRRDTQEKAADEREKRIMAHIEKMMAQQEKMEKAAEERDSRAQNRHSESLKMMQALDEEIKNVKARLSGPSNPNAMEEFNPSYQG